MTRAHRIIRRPDLTALLSSDPITRGLGHAGAQVFTMGECRIIIQEEPTGWHLSISCADRYPTWDEIAEARYALLPKYRDFVMHLPPPAEYVNIQEFTFHLFEHPERQNSFRRGGAR